MSVCNDPKCLEPTHTIIWNPGERAFDCRRCGVEEAAPSFSSDEFMVAFVAFIQKHKRCPLTPESA